jgi:hypothetical protein
MRQSIATQVQALTQKEIRRRGKGVNKFERMIEDKLYIQDESIGVETLLRVRTMN